MKNYFKKFSIMFVMSLILVFGSCISVFAADTTSQSIKINNSTLNFDKIIYVDGTKGNNDTGDGSESYPYSTITKALTNITTKNSAIFLKGTTIEPSDSINLNDKGITVVGDYLKYGSKITSRIQHGNINIYNTYLYNNSYGDEHAYTEIFAYIGDLNLYNCIFEEKSGFSNVYVTNANYYNCLITKQGKVIHDPIKFVNCAFSSTTNSNNNNNLANVTYDNAFNITSNGWKNAGVGINPDGTQANIGVYGGEFAWNYLDQNDESISLDKSSMDLTEGASGQLTATTTPAAVGVTWTSSDASVATVDSNGKVAAVAVGTATITATTTDGNNLSASCAVNVIAKGPDPEDPTDTDKIVNIAHAKGDNTNNAGGDVTIIFHGTADTTLSVVKTADVKDVWVGDNFTYTIVVTNTGTKTAKAVVVNDPAPNHINFNVNGVTTTQGSVDSSSTSKNIIVNVGDIAPGATVTIKVPATVIA